MGTDSEILGDKEIYRGEKKEIYRGGGKEIYRRGKDIYWGTCRYRGGQRDIGDT